MVKEQALGVVGCVAIRTRGAMQGLLTDDIERVRDSFDRLWPVSARISDIFYARLFEIAPHTRPLFQGDMDGQRRKFMSTLAVIVGSLDETSKLVPVMDTLASQHHAYGVRATYYDVVGEALLWSLEQGLGSDWNPNLADSWSKAYGVVSRHMIEHLNSA